MKNDNIKVSTTTPGLDRKIKIDVKEKSDMIYWHIKFNIPLDPSTVSENTMNVTDTGGYIMKTSISYNKGADRISISPKDSYQQNRFYLLNISKAVKSERGNHLKSEIHILFKLLRDQISEYKILSKNVTVPKPMPRPRDYEAKNPGSKVYMLEKEKGEKLSGDKMSYADFRLNLWGGLAGMLLVLGSVPLRNFYVTAAAAALFLAGTSHVVYQFAQKSTRAVFAYNKGVRRFNAERYEAAKKSFEKAARLDERLEQAEYGLSKVKHYI